MNRFSTLSQFSNHPLELRHSIGGLVYTILLKESRDSIPDTKITDELERLLNIELPESIMFLLTNKLERCLDLMSKLAKNEKETLLLAIVDISRKNGTASEKAQIVLRLFEKIGLTEQEQTAVIIKNDMLQKNDDGTYTHAKLIVKDLMRKEVEKQTLNLMDRDPLKNSPLEGTSFLNYLSNIISLYKKTCYANKAELGIDDIKIEEIFHEIFEELTAKYLNFRS